MLERSQHRRRLGPIMEQLRQPTRKLIGIQQAAENDDVDMFKQAEVAE
jgi:hypothetical protein